MLMGMWGSSCTISLSSLVVGGGRTGGEDEEEGIKGIKERIQ